MASITLNIKEEYEERVSKMINSLYSENSELTDGEKVKKTLNGILKKKLKIFEDREAEKARVVQPVEDIFK